MPNLLDIRRRIRSVKNTQQITQAMKMVSAAKLRRAQEQALAARPYSARLQEMIRELAPYLDPDALAGVATAAGTPIAPLLARRPLARRLVIAVSSDKGLAGAFNANVIKAVAALGPAPHTDIVAVGRKARDYFRRHGALAAEHLGVFGRAVDYQAARDIAADLMRRYAAAEVDEVVLVGNEFKSVIQQRIVTHRLLPLELPAAAGPARDYLFESDPALLLGRLLPQFLETQVYRSLLESFAAEHAARMNAMEAATTNAGELIDSLTLNMNRVRQAFITKEIIEVVSGAAALD